MSDQELYNPVHGAHYAQRGVVLSIKFQGVKQHFVPHGHDVRRLLYGLHDDMTRRKHKLVLESSIVLSGLFIEPTNIGVCHATPRTAHLTVGGFSVECPDHAMDALLHQLQLAKRRAFRAPVGTEYMKLYSRLHCWVLPWSWRDQLLDGEWTMEDDR